MIRNEYRIVVALCALVLLQALPTTASGDEVSDVEATTGQWLDAFNRKNAKDIVALYAPDAVFFGTSSPLLRHNPDMVWDYFKNLPTSGDATISMGEHRVQVFGSIAINSGYYTRSSQQDGKVVRNPARFTFVYAKRDGRWLIVNHHSSALP